MASHRTVPIGSGIEILQHLVAALDEEDVDLLAGVAQSAADQIRALDRILNPEQADFRIKAERLDHLSQLFYRTNRQRAELAAWATVECAYCGGVADPPVRRAGRLYCDDQCARAAA